MFLRILTLVFLLGTFACFPEPDPRTLLDEGRVDEAVQAIEKALDQTPDDHVLNQLYGEALMAAGHPSLAIWPLRRAAESPEGGPLDRLLLAKAHLAGGSSDDAIAVVDRLLEDHPGLIEAMEVRINAQWSLNRAALAVGDIETLLEHKPDDFFMRVRYIGILLDLEREDEVEAAIEAAKEVLNERVEVGREDPGFWEGKLCALEASFVMERGEEGFMEKTEALLEQCLESYPSSTPVLERALHYFDQQGDFARSGEILETALEDAPESIELRFSLASRLAGMGREEEAEELLLQIPENGRAADFKRALVAYYISREEFEKAVQPMRELMSGFANMPLMGRIEFIDLLIRSDELDEAEQELEKIDKPEFVSFLKGRLALARGEPEKALILLDESILYWPGNSVARQLAGQAAERLGKFDRAREEYLEALRSSATNWEALEKFARIAEGLGVQGPLAQLVERYIAERPLDPRAYDLQFETGLWSGRRDTSRGAVFRLAALPGLEPHAISLEAKLRALDGGPQAAISFLVATGIVMSQPASAPALAVLAENLCSVGRCSQALRPLGQALELAPDYALLHEIRGRVLAAGGGSPEEAREAFENAVRLNPERAEGWVGLAELAADEGDMEGALNFYDRAAEVDWLDPEPEWKAIQLLTEVEAPQAMIDARLELLLAEHGEHGEACLLLATRIADKGEDPERAEALAERAVLLQQGEPARGLLERIRGENEEEAQGASFFLHPPQVQS